MQRKRFLRRVLACAAILAMEGLVIIPASAAVTPPDLSVCDSETCDTLADKVCTPAGYVFALKNFSPANAANSGVATYTYEICNPTAGTCSLGNKTCESNEACANTCKNNGTCSLSGSSCASDADCAAAVCQGKTVNGEGTTCVPDSIKGLGLSHFDVSFPALGGVGSCLSDTTQISGSCSASTGATVGNFVLGDGSCFTGNSPVAKCDNTSLPPGTCITISPYAIRAKKV